MRTEGPSGSHSKHSPTHGGCCSTSTSSAKGSWLDKRDTRTRLVTAITEGRNPSYISLLSIRTNPRQTTAARTRNLCLYFLLPHTPQVSNTHTAASHLPEDEQRYQQEVILAPLPSSEPRTNAHLGHRPKLSAADLHLIQQFRWERNAKASHWCYGKQLQRSWYNCKFPYW